LEREENKNKIAVLVPYQYVLKNGTGFKPGTSLKKKKEKRKLHIEVNYENCTAE
jgi:hypothetical protein